MTKRIGRGGWLAAVGVLALLSVVWAGSPPATPEELASACIDDMSLLHDQALDRLTSEYLALEGAMNSLPIDTPPPRAFKLFSTGCKRLDAIERSSSSKIVKTASKCLTKLQRMGAAQPLLDDIATARDELTGDLAVQLRQNFQKEAADRLSEFVQAN